MILLQREQITQRVIDATEVVRDELQLHKGSFAAGGKKSFIDDDLSIDFLKPKTVGQQFTVEEIRKKLQASFLHHNLKDVDFEFGIAYFDKNGIDNRFTRQSERFTEYLVDSVNHRPFMTPLISPSGSPAENLTPDEMLIVIVPNLK